jgi:hypothetical protein
LSGFTDAEGCFTAVVQARDSMSTGFQIKLRFILDQKNGASLFDSIRTLFGGGGSVALRKTTDNVYRLDIKSFTACHIIRHYFLSFPLKTKKKESFLRWCEIYDLMLKDKHLTTEGVEKIREIKRFINRNNSKTTRIGEKLT